MVLYRKLHTERARELRANMTDAERKLWMALREGMPAEFRFRRQVPIGRIIVDFACLAAQLVIEVDGGQHYTEDGIASDKARDAFLSKQGFQVLRFSNLDVLTNTDGVAAMIHASLATAIPSKAL